MCRPSIPVAFDLTRMCRVTLRQRGEHFTLVQDRQHLTFSKASRSPAISIKRESNNRSYHVSPFKKSNSSFSHNSVTSNPIKTLSCVLPGALPCILHATASAANDCVKEGVRQVSRGCPTPRRPVATETVRATTPSPLS